MGPSARVSLEQRAGTAGGSAGRDDSLSLCITGLPKPKQGLVTKVHLIQKVLSCFFPFEFFSLPGSWMGEGAGSRPGVGTRTFLPAMG